MQALEYCQRKIAASETVFGAGIRFMPQMKREAITVLLAYYGELNDVVNDCADANVAMATLRWWQQQLALLFTNESTPEHPVMQALQPIVKTHRLPENELAALIEGKIMTLTQARYVDFTDWQRHAQLTAGALMRLMVRILGFSQTQTIDYADHLGMALQLTQVIRNVGEEARRGRICLPMNDLQQFEVTADVILHLQGGEVFQALMAFEIQRAENLYREAIALLPSADAKKQKAGLITAAINYALLQEIKIDGAANVLRYKLAIPKPRQLRIALKTRLWGFKP